MGPLFECSNFAGVECYYKLGSVLSEECGFEPAYTGRRESPCAQDLLDLVGIGN